MKQLKEELNVSDAVEEIYMLIQLAGTYLEDGAPFTAAQRLAEASQLCEQLGAHRAHALKQLADEVDRS